MKAENLIDLAKDAMQKAYAPYSNFWVGAAVLCADGTVYQGCNIENAAYGECICAERNAVFKAVFDGHRDFSAIAIVGGRGSLRNSALPAVPAARFCGNSARMISGST